MVVMIKMVYRIWFVVSWDDVVGFICVIWCFSKFDLEFFVVDMVEMLVLFFLLVFLFLIFIFSVKSIGK